jgi:hypothetical protein
MNCRSLVLFGLALFGGSDLRAQAACKAEQRTDARAFLRNAVHALGADNLQGAALHLRMTDATLEDYQSDRAYPPFFLAFSARESWYQPATGVARQRGRFTFPHSDGELPDFLSGSKASFVVRDTVIQPAPSSHAGILVLRGLDPWAQLYDWQTSEKVTVVGRCTVRDYPRTVLQRTGPYGRERLALDPKTGLPVSLEREESHYLWGQLSVGYVYSNWKVEGGFSYSGSSFRTVDGAPEVSRTVSLAEAISTDSVPSLALPDTAATMVPAVAGFLKPSPPDSVRVSDNVRLLVNPGYTEGVALLGDTVYVLDATQGEERARGDSTMIARLFPGRHPIVLVVTDVAWPHIAGLRYWVARGATVVSHRASRPFLERVLQRRWTRAPDLYERRRNQTRFSFRAVNDSLLLARGKLRLYAIDGIASEGALMAYVEGDRFLWASDYIQQLDQPSTYAIEVWRAAGRVGIQPLRTAAQHLRLTPWSTIDSLARADRPRDAS